MRFRTYKNTDLNVSEVGRPLDYFHRLVGEFHEGEAIPRCMHKALDLGCNAV